MSLHHYGVAVEPSVIAIPAVKVIPEQRDPSLCLSITETRLQRFRHIVLLKIDVPEIYITGRSFSVVCKLKIKRYNVTI